MPGSSRLVLAALMIGPLIFGGDAELSAASLRGLRLRLRQRSVNRAVTHAPT
jgi:hypothetical protein